MIELKDTVEMMLSPDYKERFKAEYYQVAIRYNKLQSMLNKWKMGELGFQPTCSMAQLEWQLDAMGDYKSILETRAKMENILI